MTVERKKRMADLREDARRIDALLGGMLARVSREMDEAIKRYQRDSNTANAKRKKEGEFKAMLFPRVKTNAVGMPRVYWEVLRARGKYAQQRGMPSRKHIPRNKHEPAYSEQKLRKYTDEFDHDAVIEAQKNFERLERFAAPAAKAARAIKELIDE